jgi:TRAP-type C4-dicarboxylate transport system permease small subunit
MKLQAFRNGVVKVLENILIVCMIGLTLAVLWGVFTRFCMGRQASFTDELARVLLVWVSMIGAALAFGLKAHLGVDFFINKLSPDARKVLSVVVQLVTIILTVVIFLMGGVSLTLAQMGQVLPTMPWLSRGMVYAAIPVSGVFILLFTIENLVVILKTPAEKLGAQTQSEG